MKRVEWNKECPEWMQSHEEFMEADMGGDRSPPVKQLKNKVMELLGAREWDDVAEVYPQPDSDDEEGWEKASFFPQGDMQGCREVQQVEDLHGDGFTWGAISTWEIDGERVAVAIQNASPLIVYVLRFR